MASMDDLSEDTIHYEIMPFLSYEDRINFNRTLKPEHRRTKKFAKKDKNVTLKHELSVLIIQIKITIAKVEESLTSKDSFDNILKVVKLLIRPRFSIVIAHYVDFRQNLFNKIQNLYTLAGGEFNNISNDYIKEFREILHSFLDFIKSLKPISEHLNPKQIVVQ